MRDWRRSYWRRNGCWKGEIYYVLDRSLFVGSRRGIVLAWYKRSYNLAERNEEKRIAHRDVTQKLEEFY